MPRLEATDTDTAVRILDAAERLVQTRGFNGFSYADVAAELGVTKASLHYHYPGKAELGQALIERYTRRFVLALDSIDETDGDAPAKLESYADLYAAVLRGERMCLCGMLAAEFDTLSEGMRSAVIRFFDANEAWLERVLAAGKRDGSLDFVGSPREMAMSVIGGLEGAMLIARPYRDAGRFGTAAERLLATLVPAAG
jgi:TetR/AcrR family transcriptional regulator, transcriptional repressor for nem operon